MATKVIMPKQGLQMTEGIITSWLVQEGQPVAADAPLFEMETDKLNIEITAQVSGTLLKILHGAGDTVPITETIAIIGEPGEDITALLGGSHPEIAAAADTAKVEKAASAMNAGPIREAGARLFITPRAKTAAAAQAIDISPIKGSGPDGLIIERDILSFKSAPPAEPKATPLAARLAGQNEIDLQTVTGTGARGKIIRADVAAALISQPAAPAQLTGKDQLIPFSGMRKVIADRMMQSLQGMAQANHRMKVDMSEVVRFREKLKEAGVKVSYTDIIIKVVARALRDFPILNSTMTAAGILLIEAINVGMAVAVDKGLIVPVIKHADRLTLPEIAATAAELAAKARQGNLQPDEYAGGTFTITNLGMFDIDEFTAIINPPESAILAVGKIDRIPVAEGESVVIRPVLILSLTYDHRIIDGAPAAQFLQKIKLLLQNPYLLL